MMRDVSELRQWLTDVMHGLYSRVTKLSMKGVHLNTTDEYGQ